MVALIGSSAIMFVVLYAAHGFSARTSTALVGTLFGLIMIALLGLGASRWAHLTGVASEEDFVLSAAAPDLTLTSVVLCGIIVAGLGVLNDVTITQASAVWELADEGLGQRHLFAKAMRIGRDHIASTVYTIAFATAGAALSVLLLISIYDRPLLQIVQTEQFAGEIIRTLVGAIGLVLAVPLTTAVGVAVVRASHSAVAPPRRRPRPRRRRRRPARVGAGAVRRRGAGGNGVGPPRPGDHGDLRCGRGHRRAAGGQPRRRRDRGAARHQVADLRPGADGADRHPSAPPAPARTGSTASGSTHESASGEGRRSRRSRRREEDDDFGDFTYLREPDDTDPGPPTDPGPRTDPGSSRGRRAR